MIVHVGCAVWLKLDIPASEGIARMRGVTSRAAADTPRRSFSPPHGRIEVVRAVEAQYEDGVLRPAQRLSLRPGEQVSLIVVRRPDPSRWDLARLVKAANGEDLALAEQGLTEWSGELDATERA